MGRVSNGRLAELWRGRIRRQERSGLSIGEYCRREGVSPGSYYLWKRQEFQEKVRRRSGSHEGVPGSVTSYAWLYTGLDKAAPYDIFHWSLTHENCWIDSHLASFEGVFVGDATGANARLEQRSQGRIVHVGCNSHARREFIAAETTHPVEAAKALAYYQLLFDIEDKGKLLDEAGLLKLRQCEGVRVWNAFEKWADSVSPAPLLKSPLGKALGYFRNDRIPLKRYLNDARFPIDNNFVGAEDSASGHRSS